MNRERAKLIMREAVFRAFCRHHQGQQPNILLFCTRRGGSTWVLNTVAAHPGMRYVGRPFMTILNSRWRNEVPSLKDAAGYHGSRTLRQIIHFEGEDEKRFRNVASNIINAKWHIHPSINFRARYFNRKTNRVIFQMTSGLPLIKWFQDNFDVKIGYLIRHPVPTALSIMEFGWEPECFEFLENRYFVENLLTSNQIDVARRIENSDDLLGRHVLDWCLKNLVPLKEIENQNASNWLCLSYEDLVLRPIEVVRHMANDFGLNDVESMLRQVKLPSRTVTSSTSGRVEDSSYLLSRWRDKISNDQEKALMKILDAFELDIYTVGRDEPTSAVFRCG